MKRFLIFLLLSTGLMLSGCGGAEDPAGDTGSGDGPADPNAPVLDSIGGRQTDPGAQLSFTLSATDANGDDLTFSAAGVGTPNIFGIGNSPSLNPTSGAFSWTPAGGDDNQYQIRFTVTDSSSAAYSDSETITVSVMGPLTSGKILYEDNCERCHGVNGQGAPGYQSVKCVERDAIKQGMPNFGLTDPELDDISAWLIYINGDFCNPL